MTSLSTEQTAIVVGSLLGDGSMRCKTSALLEINHCAAQRAYVDWKYRALASLVRTPPRERPGNDGRRAYRFVTASVPALTPFYNAFYGSGAKAVPRGLDIEPLALAVWFMDDGSRSRSSVYLNTQQFDLASQAQLLQTLYERYAIAGTLNKDKTYFRIRIRVRSIERFCNIVRPYVLAQMMYKLPC